MSKVHKLVEETSAKNTLKRARTSPRGALRPKIGGEYAVPLPGDGSVFLLEKIPQEPAEIPESADSKKRVFEIASWNGRSLMVIEKVDS